MTKKTDMVMFSSFICSDGLVHFAMTDEDTGERLEVSMTFEETEDLYEETKTAMDAYLADHDDDEIPGEHPIEQKPALQ